MVFVMNNGLKKIDILLVALRKITRAIDLNSKKLTSKYGLTGPQLIVLKVIYQSAEHLINSTQLAREVSLSQGTITSILDRLEDKGYIEREKSTQDKRKIFIKTTERAQQIFAQDPKLFQEEFIEQFGALKLWEQDMLIASLERLADMMGTNAIGASN